MSEDLSAGLHEAEKLLQQGLAADAEARLRSLLAEAPAGPQQALLLDAMGRTLHCLQRPAEARQALTQAVELLQTTLGAHQATAVVLQHLAHFCRAVDDLDASFKHGQEAVNMLIAVHGEDHPLVAASLFSLSHSIYIDRRYTEAEAMVRRAMGIWERRHGPECPEIASCLNNLGRIYEERGQLDEGIALHRQAVNMRRKLFGEHPETAFSLGNLGTALASAGQFSEAIDNLEQAIACYAACGLPHAPEVPGYRENLRVCREALAAENA